MVPLPASLSKDYVVSWCKSSGCGLQLLLNTLAELSFLFYGVLFPYQKYSLRFYSKLSIVGITRILYYKNKYMGLTKRVDAWFVLHH